MPLLAAIGLIAVSLIPSIAVPGEVDVTGVRAARRRDPVPDARRDAVARASRVEREADRTAGVPATALGIGAIAVVVAVVAAPLLPQPVVRAGSGTLGTGPGIDATLQLGDDLRRPREVEVLHVRTNAPTAPYLRATTLSQLDGDVWEPDRVRTVPLESERGARRCHRRRRHPPDRVHHHRRGDQPRVAVAAGGVSRRRRHRARRAMGGSALQPHACSARPATTQGQTYEVVTNVPRPTLEQIREHSAPAAPSSATGRRRCPRTCRRSSASSPPRSPPRTTNDYDALVALQRWFRGAEFRYSLDAPVEDGFDGSGHRSRRAVPRGARGLLRPLRVGVRAHGPHAGDAEPHRRRLPAGHRDQRRRSSRETVYSVSSGQLHAWPEVYFEGVGWVPFEPTDGLGVADDLHSGRHPPPAVPTTPRAATPAPSSSASVDPGPLTRRPGRARRTAARPGRPPAP